jgi:putative resolvase
VVAYKDRLCRFGFQLFESLCKRFEVRIVVHNREETGSDRELSEDLLAIINFFVARNNGRRAGQNRKRRRQTEDSNILPEADEEAKEGAGSVVRGLPVDLQPVC